MKKFFLLIAIGLVIINTGCMTTDYAYVRTVYIHETGYYNNSLPVYEPIRVQTVHVGSSTRGTVQYYDSHHNYHNYRNYNYQYNRGYNNGSPVYVTPAPSAWSLQNMIPR